MIAPENHIDPNVKKWFAIFTKYKTEKYVVDKLTKKGIKAYVPLLSYTKRYTRKIKHYKVPLINCYAFVHISKDEYVKVLETEYVKGFLKINKSLISIPQNEIEILQKIVGENERVLAEPTSFQEGQEVEVIQGNLTGIKGKLISIEGKHEFLIDLNTLSYQFRVHIDPKYLRPIHANLIV
jgi:transcription antitermination factor NusG